VKNRVLSLLLAAVLALGVGLIGCGSEEVPKYNLTISSTEGGSVTSPGEPGPYTYDEGKVVNLVAVAEEGYQFAAWTGDVSTVADVEDATTTITMNGDYSVTATFAVKQYSLIVRSTEGGSVTTPGENAYAYDKGEVVNLVAVAEEGYVFMNWTGDVSTIADVNAASTTITMNGGYSVTANFVKGIWDWYDLDAIRNNLDGSYVLMNDLDSSTAGYTELASRTANGGKGLEPIGSLAADPDLWDIVDPIGPFTGAFCGQGYEIGDLYIARPDEEGVGLFGFLGEGGVVQNVGLVSGEVIGRVYVGGLVGLNQGTMHQSYSAASVTGIDIEGRVGGLVGQNSGAISNSYCSGSVVSHARVGGLVGDNGGTVSDSYFSGTISGERWVGGLVGLNLWGTANNSHYNCDEVGINGEKVITIGALFAEDFEQWLVHDMSLDVNERLSQENGYYIINNLADFKQLLAFGQDESLKFRLKSDVDLANDPNFYIPYLAGEFDGNGHRILSLAVSVDFASHVGLFGYVGRGGKVTRVGVDNLNIVGGEHLGGLVGANLGSVSDSYCVGNVAGRFHVGGLLGGNWGTLSNSWFSSGSVTGHGMVGGLIGEYGGGPVRNSHYNYDEVFINGQNMITIGAMLGEDFAEWVANDRFLDVDERLSQEDGYYVIDNVSDFKELLAFGQNSSLKFKLRNDLYLSNDPNFYIPYLAGEFHGNGHKIADASVHFDFLAEVGLFGVLAQGARISELSVENVNIGGWWDVGGVVGRNDGTVSNCHSSGSVAGTFVDIGGLIGGSWGQVDNSYSGVSVSGGQRAGGLVGTNWWSGIISNSYATGGVSGHGQLGGLLGWNNGSVSGSYSTGRVAANDYLGGLVGYNRATVSNSFWDTQTSGQSTSAGGTGKTTAEMKNITTFSAAGWNIIAVANPNIRNPSYIWNIVDGQTYPFLSWQPVS